MKRKIFAFDLDGTLAESKSPIDGQMKNLLKQISQFNPICVVSGGNWGQFQEQLLDHLVEGTVKGNLHCFPTCGTTYYRYRDGDWEQVYNHPLSVDEKNDILATFDTAMALSGYDEPVTFGDVIEDRDTQITFSALGQKAPIMMKEEWDPDGSRRSIMVEIMRPMLPGFDVRFGGTTSIDVTRKGHDKRLAVEKIKEYLKVEDREIVYFGDKLLPKGNDHAVYKAGIECIPVDNHIDCVWKVLQFMRTLVLWHGE
jgi:HAD superfamily hydrolase (TIGR01484 family)